MVALAAIGAVVAMGAAAIAGGNSRSRGEEVTSVLQHAEDFIGRTTTITGRVGEIISATAFTLTDGDAAVLVLNVPVMPAIDDNLDGVLVAEHVDVTGEVRILDIEAIKSYVGELSNERSQPFLGKPVILADVVRPR